MYILDKLWRGTLSFDEEVFNSDNEYDALRQELLQKENQIAAALSHEKQDLFKEYQEIRAHMTAISEEAAFTTGFRTGVKMMLDSIS